MKLTVRDAAALLSLPESDIYRRIEDGDIPFRIVNHQPLIGRAELLEWATERRIPLSVELFDEGAAGAVSLAAAIDRGGIHYGVHASDAASLLREVVARLPIDDDERELALEIMLAREAESSTGVGRGIAIPHVRRPLVVPGRAPSITLCFLDQPVAFAAIDREPVHTVFAMTTPTIQSHLQLLSRLSLALHDKQFAAEIEKRASRDAIIAEAKRTEQDATRKRPEGNTT